MVSKATLSFFSAQVAGQRGVMRQVEQYCSQPSWGESEGARKSFLGNLCFANDPSDNFAFFAPFLYKGLQIPIDGTLPKL
jgi:hypothetical protein